MVAERQKCHETNLKLHDVTIFVLKIRKIEWAAALRSNTPQIQKRHRKFWSSKTYFASSPNLNKTINGIPIPSSAVSKGGVFFLGMGSGKDKVLHLI